MPLEQLLLNTVLGLLSFYLNLSNSLSVSAQAGTWGFDRDCMKSADHTGNTAISRTPSLPSHEHEVSSHVSRPLRLRRASSGLCIPSSCLSHLRASLLIHLCRVLQDQHASLAFIFAIKMLSSISGIISNTNNNKYKHAPVKQVFSTATPSVRVNTGLTLRSQVVLSSRLEGLRSRCSTLAEWIYFNPLRIW